MRAPWTPCSRGLRLRRRSGWPTTSRSATWRGGAGISEAHVPRAFRAATGHSALRFGIGRRMEQAKVLLRTTRPPVAEVAFHAGHEDGSRFAEHFRREAGTTPGAWRPC